MSSDAADEAEEAQPGRAKGRAMLPLIRLRGTPKTPRRGWRAVAELTALAAVDGTMRGGAAGGGAAGSAAGGGAAGNFSGC